MAHSQYASNVFLYGSNEDKRYSIDEKTVTMATGMKSGSVLTAAGAWVAIATVATAAMVLLDERADQEVELTAGAHTLKCIVRAAGVGRNYLNYADAVSAANKTTAEGALLALGIKTEAQA